MPLIQPNEAYRRAAAGGYGLGAFNVNSVESVRAVLEAAENQRSPLILQVSMGARKYVRYLAPFVQYVKACAAQCAAPVFLQHDHCTDHEACVQAIEAGVQAVMFDGSHLPYEENLAETRRVADYAHARGVWVEAELGCLPGFEDLVFAEKAVYTDPALVPDFIRRSGCDALAVAVGTSHGGVQGPGYLPLDFERLKKLVKAAGDTPLVLHGGASLPPALIEACNAQGGRVEFLRNCSEESVARAVELGVRKVNMDVDNFLVFTTETRRFLNERPELYDPRKYLEPGREGFRREVEHKLARVMHSAGRAQAGNGSGGVQ